VRLHEGLVMGRRVRKLAQLLARLLPHGASVLDVGAGSGQIARALLERRPDLRVEGIDVLLRPHSAVPVRPFDGLRIPEADRSWDVCLFVDVLHHCEWPEALLAEAKRVARDCVLVKDHLAASALDHWLLRFMDWFGNRGHGVLLPFHYLDRRSWEAMFGRLGLAVEHFQTRLGLYPWPFRWIFDRQLHFIARLALRPER
jgi:SAM-dependent methyltransferase